MKVTCTGRRVTLHLATKVGVARSVNNIDLISLIIDRHVLGKNRDTSFPFQIIVIHELIRFCLSFTEKLTG